MSPINNKIDLVEIYWTKNDKEHKVCFPRETAGVFLNKHLIPQENLGILINVGIREIN